MIPLSKDIPKERSPNNMVFLFHPVDAAASETAKEKAVAPLDSVDEVNTLVSYFLNKGCTRDALMCVIQLNFGLRISDVLWLRWKDLFYDDGSPRESNEIKTQKTGAIAKFYINDAVVEAANLHKKMMGHPCDMSEDGFIFISDRGGRAGYNSMYCRKSGANVRAIKIQPMNVSSASRIITTAAKESGLYREDRHISTHSLRKTALNAVAGALSGLEPDKDLVNMREMLKVAQHMAAHSSSKTTDNHYLTKRYQVEAVKKMCLGLEAIRAYEQR